MGGAVRNLLVRDLGEGRSELGAVLLEAIHEAKEKSLAGGVVTLDLEAQLDGVERAEVAHHRHLSSQLGCMLQDRRQLLERGRDLRLASFHLLFSDSLFFFAFILLFYYIFTAALHQGRQREPSLAAVIVVPCCVHGVRVEVVVSTARKTG